MLKKRILVISWFYPPVNSSEGLVTYKLLKASQYSYDVFTQKNNALWSYGNKDTLPEAKNVNSIFAKAKSLNDWMLEAVEYYRENIDKYDIVMTRSMPPESHKIGLKLKEINPKLKWIASFGDPIANNPYTEYSITYASPYITKVCKSIKGIISPKRIVKNTIFKIRYKRLHKFYQKKDFKLQDLTFKNADCLIFNSTYQKDYMLNSYNSEISKKALILYHSFDLSLYPKIRNDNDKIKISYIGLLDNIRNPYRLFDAIRILNENDPDLSKKVVFEFYGNISDSDKLFIINYELTDVIKIKKPVSYLKSLEIMQNSDWLLLIDANISNIINKNIFFAAKLADYMGTGNKIFGITMLDGISADILRKLNAITTSYSTQEIKNYLWLIIYSNYTIKMNDSFRSEFDSKKIAKKFDDFISSSLL